MTTVLIVGEWAWWAGGTNAAMAGVSCAFKKLLANL